MGNIKTRAKIRNYSWSHWPKELLIHIFNYLGRSDLREIGLVSKHWHVLMQLPQFKQKSKLVINRYNMATLYDSFQNDVEFSRRLAYEWVEMHDIKICDKLKLILKLLGPTIHKLTLYNSPVFAILNDCLPELEELTLRDIPILQNKNWLAIDLNKFKGFKCLDVKCTNVSPAIKNHMMLNLTREVTLNMETFCIKMRYSEQQEILRKCLQFHSESLKHLEIAFSRSSPGEILKWKQTFQMFKHLEVLKINGVFCALWLANIINALPKEAPLRHIVLSENSLKYFMKLIINKWPDTLIDMEINNYDFDKNNAVEDLVGLRHTLHSLTIRNTFKKSSINGLLQGMASETNYTLTSLSLAKCYCSDFLEFHDLIQRLPNLTYLSLENCVRCVNGTVLSKIFRHQSQLQHLNLNGCSGITNEDLLGVCSRSANITNLKRLQSLGLRFSEKITDIALIECFKFIELRKLEISFCHKISCAGIKEMVKNCSALEDLTLSNCFSLNDDSILYIAQGLPRLRRLNVTGCKLLTNKSLEYILNHCKSLKELQILDIQKNFREEWQQVIKEKLNIS